ncbi:DUF2285 domain-containing protein [Mesorhizobium sp. WSM3860]|uniref:DNA -binding domain-containing protein n=1 Tax=Mesorhizobium sp. WSM3860 TaxID=2029403 RepID=UPI001FE10BDB|nr:DUF2285 domain-containing protein [Mesorhizobium sp. WSM3860]
MRQQLNAFECLNAPHARTVPAVCALSKALAGWLSGASHREITRARLGRQCVQADWPNRNHLRDRIRRAVRRGDMLMDRGNQDFLV